MKLPSLVCMTIQKKLKLLTTLLVPTVVLSATTFDFWHERSNFVSIFHIIFNITPISWECNKNNSIQGTIFLI